MVPHDNYVAMEGGTGFCQICGKRSTGIYYKVEGCVGCRSFYRRSLKRGGHFECKYNNNCSTYFDTGKQWCVACRYRKYSMLSAEKRCQHKRAADVQKSAKAVVPAEINRTGHGDIYGQRAPSNNKWTVQNNKKSVSINGKCQTRTLSGDVFLDEQTVDRLEHHGTNPFSESVSRTMQMQNGAENCPPAPEVSSSPTSLICRTTSLSHKPYFNQIFLPFDKDFMGDVSSNWQQIATTIQAVRAATDLCFGDQIRSWTTCRDMALYGGLAVHQPEAHPIYMREAIKNHSIDNVMRTQMFAASLSGIQQLGGSRRRSPTDWKPFVCSLIHHAPFVLTHDMYILVGPHHLHYSRYWQEQEGITNIPYQVFMVKFARLIQDLELDQIERYLLMSIVILEPGENDDTNLSLNIVHQHYIDALLSAIQQRCHSDQVARHTALRKLSEFFGILKIIVRTFRMFFNPGREPKDWPPCSVDCHKQIRDLQCITG